MSAGVEDTDSIAVYGVRQQIVNGGSRTATEATQQLNLWVRENAWPRTTQSIDLSGSGRNPIVTFKCLGYWSMFDYYYHNVADASGSITGLVDVSAKMASIIDYDWAGYFSSANASLATNTTPTKAYEGEWTEASALLGELVAAGDSAYNRYRFMVGPDRHITYAPVPSEVAYYQTISEGRQMIYDASGQQVKPWNVQPGGWCRITDWIAAKDDPVSTFYGDSRYMLIEQVDFGLPWNVKLLAGRSDKLTQFLAQLGLLGVR